MIRAIPTINTARLTLGAMRPEDFDRFSEIWSDPGVVRFIGGEPRGRRQSWEAFLRNSGHWEMTGFGQWAVFDNSCRRMVGQAGFFFGNRPLGDDFDAFPEAGWVLVPELHGQGLGHEATRAAHDWFDRVIPGPVVARIHAEHISSLKLAERLGYHRMRVIDDAGDPLVLLRRDGPPGS